MTIYGDGMQEKINFMERYLNRTKSYAPINQVSPSPNRAKENLTYLPKKQNK